MIYNIRYSSQWDFNQIPNSVFSYIGRYSYLSTLPIVFMWLEIQLPLYLTYCFYVVGREKLSCHFLNLKCRRKKCFYLVKGTCTAVSLNFAFILQLCGYILKVLDREFCKIMQSRNFLKLIRISVACIVVSEFQV